LLLLLAQAAVFIGKLLDALDQSVDTGRDGAQLGDQVGVVHAAR
jgi:hypothetical protein